MPARGITLNAAARKKLRAAIDAQPAEDRLGAPGHVSATARAIGVNPLHLAAVLGGTKDPSKDLLDRLCRRLGLRVKVRTLVEIT